MTIRLNRKGVLVSKEIASRTHMLLKDGCQFSWSYLFTHLRPWYVIVRIILARPYA